MPESNNKTVMTGKKIIRLMARADFNRMHFTAKKCGRAQGFSSGFSGKTSSITACRPGDKVFSAPARGLDHEVLGWAE